MKKRGVTEGLPPDSGKGGQAWWDELARLLDMELQVSGLSSQSRTWGMTQA